MTQQQIIEESNYLAIQFADADIDVRIAIKIGFQYAANWRIDGVRYVCMMELMGRRAPQDYSGIFGH